MSSTMSGLELLINEEVERRLSDILDYRVGAFFNWDTFDVEYYCDDESCDPKQLDLVTQNFKLNIAKAILNDSDLGIDDIDVENKFLTMARNLQEIISRIHNYYPPKP